ncbi:hypothetical protein IFM89_001947 [Coptis chinensis]|uniref:Uncharacterized protein n=1 Tax=Coptis chinensis TaxID=261450 RepID=A0A835ISN3_9MAGN|nr:hypothetical protein IFM89_001947 [Coptis chinensis]
MHASSSSSGVHFALKWCTGIVRDLSAYNLQQEIFLIAQYQEVQKLPHGRPQLLHSEQGHGIVGYLIALLSNQLNQLWKVSPILAAIAIPLWCPLFRLYMLEIETQFKGDSSKIRCCSCIKDGKKHIDCELAERIWCLYAIHIQGANLMENTISP